MATVPESKKPVLLVVDVGAGVNTTATGEEVEFATAEASVARTRRPGANV